MKKIFFSLIILITTAYLFLNLISEAEGSSMKLMSSAFKNGGVLPTLYTCDGKNINPPLEWTDAPAGTKSFMLIMEDPDAPATKPNPWVHWIVFNIPPSANEIKENLSLKTLNGAKQGLTNSGKSEFHGACPPDKMHRYYFILYALDTTLNLLEGASKGELMGAIEGHILAKAELMATYERN
jgi:Raf kinase inhibitor-like YbhB/YbcL family protein